MVSYSNSNLFFLHFFYHLFKSYLENRHFTVRSGFSFSEISPICAGVPQGAVAAPLLFNLFTSDQPTTPYTTTGDFADDKALLALHNDPATASNLIQNHLDLLATWYKEWGLKINETKSIHCTFTLKQTGCPHIYLNNIPLPTAQNVRYLGLHLDRRLTWATHIQSQTSRLKQPLPSIAFPSHIKTPQSQKQTANVQTTPQTNLDLWHPALGICKIIQYQ